MSLHDTDSLFLRTFTTAESLPDPTGLDGRAHILVNAGTATATWSASGPPAPFLQGGAAVSTVSVPRGQSMHVQSDGVRWVARSVGSRPMFAGSGVTDGAGNASFAFPAGLFATPPNVALALQAAASNQPIDFRIVALTAVSCIVNVRQSPVLVVLSLSLLGLAAPLAGVTVHAIATPAGSTP